MSSVTIRHPARPGGERCSYETNSLGRTPAGRRCSDDSSPAAPSGTLSVFSSPVRPRPRATSAVLPARTRRASGSHPPWVQAIAPGAPISASPATPRITISPPMRAIASAAVPGITPPARWWRATWPSCTRAAGDASLFVDERGQRINGQWTGSPTPNQHDILTGSNADGTLMTGATCADWTSGSAADVGQVGHADGLGPGQSTAGALASWNSAHTTQNCADTAPRGGAGRFYCFAR